MAVCMQILLEAETIMSELKGNLRTWIRNDFLPVDQLAEYIKVGVGVRVRVRASRGNHSPHRAFVLIAVAVSCCCSSRSPCRPCTSTF